jgi:hypothetical protein
MIATEGPEMTQYQQLPENREPLKNLDFESGSNVADKNVEKRNELFTLIKAASICEVNPKATSKNHNSFIFFFGRRSLCSV